MNWDYSHYVRKPAPQLICSEPLLRAEHATVTNYRRVHIFVGFESDNTSLSKSYA